MGISQYIKEIGRGKEGARSLTREQAADLMGQVLDGTVTDLEIGGFCLAMRIKGETPEEMAGFLDAAHARLHQLPENQCTTVVLPSYNGARKLPVLTPLLALLLSREGLPVLVHGTATEDRRVSSEAVFTALGISASQPTEPLAAGKLAFLPTARLSAGLKRLLDVRCGCRRIARREGGPGIARGIANAAQGRAQVVGDDGGKFLQIPIGSRELLVDATHDTGLSGNLGLGNGARADLGGEPVLDLGKGRGARDQQQILHLLGHPVEGESDPFLA